MNTEQSDGGRVSPRRFVLGQEEGVVREDGTRVLLLDKDDHDYLTEQLGRCEKVACRFYTEQGNFAEQGWFHRGDSECLGEDYEILIRQQ